MKPEKPQLKILSFGDNLQARLALIAGLHNKSAREQQTHAIDLSMYKSKTTSAAAGEWTWSFEHESEEKLYQHIFPIDQESMRELIFTNPAPKNTRLGAGLVCDGAIWVTDGLQSAALQASVLKLLRCLGASLLIFLEASNEQGDVLDLIESDLRERCDLAGFVGNEVKVVRGESTRESAVQALYEACDEVFFPRPTKPNTFMMPIEDVFDIKRKGLIVTGQIARGIVKVGQELELLGRRPARSVTAIGVEAFRLRLDFAEAGQNIGLMLRGMQRIELERGQMLAQPGTVQVCDTFEAEAYFYSPSKGPKYPPLLGQPFDIALYSWRGQATLRTGELLANTFTSVTIRTSQPIAIELLATFAIIVEARAAGAGFVTKVFDSARFL